MPNIRSQRVYNDGGTLALEIVGSDGRSITLTKAQIQAFFQSTSGSAASRRAQTITLIKSAIISALGAETVSLAELDYDFGAGDGSITVARIGVA